MSFTYENLWLNSWVVVDRTYMDLGIDRPTGNAWADPIYADFYGDSVPDMGHMEVEIITREEYFAYKRSSQRLRPREEFALPENVAVDISDRYSRGGCSLYSVAAGR
jgi:hypothetical protein